MSDPTHLLVPVAVLQGESLSASLVEMLSSVEVTLLGYHELPDQTSTSQARTQYIERLSRRLTSYADQFEKAGRPVTTRTVFTHDAQTTIERIAIETEATAIVLPNPAPEIGQLLLAIRGAANIDQLTATTAELLDKPDAGVTLLHAARSASRQQDAQRLLATAAEAIEDAGVSTDRITTTTAVTRLPVAAIVEAADEADCLVLGERNPSLVDRIFGEIPDRVARATNSPVIVVRKPPEK